VNASASSQTMMKMLGAEQEHLKVIDVTRHAEEKEFAQEKSDLSQKLSDAKQKLDADIKSLNSLRGQNLKLHLEARSKDKATAEAKAQAAASLKESAQHCQDALANQTKKTAAERKASEDREHALQGKLEQSSRLYKELLRTNEK